MELHRDHIGSLEQAVWLTIVTMTTVGYGDKAPISGVGRFLAFVCMMAGLVLFGYFTSTVGSSLEEATARFRVNGKDDFSGKERGLRVVGVPEAVDAMKR